MNVIRLYGVVPKVFEGHLPTDPVSDVWGSDFLFEKGKSYLIKAASGRGKSSLCSYLYGLRNDFSGKIWFDQMEITELSISDWDKVRQYSIGVLFQDLRLFGELNAIENVMIKADLTSHCTKEKAISLLTEIGLGDRLERPVSLLSFGQQQRVAFVRMLCQKADFWLLDEPVSHLDMDNANIMATMLRRESAENNTGIIVTTIGHDLPYEYDKTMLL